MLRAYLYFTKGCRKGLGKAEVKRLKFKALFLFGVLAAFFLIPSVSLRADDDVAVPGVEEPVAAKTEPAAPKSELDVLKEEWEVVREQQVQMIREKEDQLEKLKEEMFSKMTTPSEPAGSGGGAEFSAQKAAFQAERQKFFAEMNRQKESLRQLQTALDEKAKQLEADRDRFEQEKKTAAL
jgi:flagellar motility protein MotE (MotC chaperone)